MSNGVADSVDVIVMPWGIEADHPRNCDLLLQCIPGQRLRSALDGSKPALDRKTGDLVVPLDQSRSLASAPKMPGMQLHVNPAKLTYVIIDPLRDNEPMLNRLEKFLSTSNGRSITGKLNGVDKLEGKLDPHQMKSLCREMLRLVESKEAKVVAGRGMGPIPDQDDVDGLPGHYLLNPGSIVANTQPKYEKDWEQWVATLSHNGG